MDQQFLLLFRGGDPARAGFLPHTAMKQWGDWVAALKRDGVFVHGEPLRPDGGCLVAPDGSSDAVDAPEVAVTGYMAIKAPTLAAARALTAGCPTLLHGGSVEIRSAFVVNGRG